MSGCLGGEGFRARRAGDEPVDAGRKQARAGGSGEGPEPAARRVGPAGRAREPETWLHLSEEAGGRAGRLFIYL